MSAESTRIEESLADENALVYRATSREGYRLEREYLRSSPGERDCLCMSRRPGAAEG
jgi:hypothetical protein